MRRAGSLWHKRHHSNSSEKSSTSRWTTLPGAPVLGVVASEGDGGSQPGGDTGGGAGAPLTPGGEETVLRTPGGHLSSSLLLAFTQRAETVSLLQLSLLVSQPLQPLVLHAEAAPEGRVRVDTMSPPGPPCPGDERQTVSRVVETVVRTPGPFLPAAPPSVHRTVSQLAPPGLLVELLVGETGAPLLPHLDLPLLAVAGPVSHLLSRPTGD